MEQTCDDLAWLALAAVGLLAALTFRDYGLGWDDYTHAEYADLLLRMYGTGFHDTGALSFANLYMYGGGFDMAAALLHKIIPLELFETRRLVGAVVGVIGLAVTWRLARRIGGPLAGLAALLLLALCPIYYGHMFMNPKDAPFAVAMIILMMGLVRLAEERKWGGLTERLLVATAASYVVSPSALGPVAADPNREIDRLSASYLIALGARIVREVGDLIRRAAEAGKRLATLAVDTEVRFRSPTDRAAFSHELAETIAKLVSKYHDASAPGGRAHRLVVVAHPLPKPSHPRETS